MILGWTYSGHSTWELLRLQHSSFNWGYPRHFQFSKGFSSKMRGDTSVYQLADMRLTILSFSIISDDICRRRRPAGGIIEGILLRWFLYKRVKIDESCWSTAEASHGRGWCPRYDRKVVAPAEEYCTRDEARRIIGTPWGENVLIIVAAIRTTRWQELLRARGGSLGWQPIGWSHNKMGTFSWSFADDIQLSHRFLDTRIYTEDGRWGIFRIKSRTQLRKLSCGCNLILQVTPTADYTLKRAAYKLRLPGSSQHHVILSWQDELEHWKS